MCWCCWCADPNDALILLMLPRLLMRWRSDAADALVLLMRWCGLSDFSLYCNYSHQSHHSTYVQVVVIGRYMAIRAPSELTKKVVTKRRGNKRVKTHTCIAPRHGPTWHKSRKYIEIEVTLLWKKARLTPIFFPVFLWFILTYPCRQEWGPPWQVQTKLARSGWIATVHSNEAAWLSIC